MTLSQVQLTLSEDFPKYLWLPLLFLHLLVIMGGKVEVSLAFNDVTTQESLLVDFYLSYLSGLVVICIIDFLIPWWLFQTLVTFAVGSKLHPTFIEEVIAEWKPKLISSCQWVMMNASFWYFCDPVHFKCPDFGLPFLILGLPWPYQTYLSQAEFGGQVRKTNLGECITVMKLVCVVTFDTRSW